MEYKHLEEVKNILGISGEYQDGTLNALINEVIEDMVDSGVHRTIAMSEKAIGTVAVGINDLWNYSAGGVKHSPYFDSRCIKLSYDTVEDTELIGSHEKYHASDEEIEKLVDEIMGT